MRKAFCERQKDLYRLLLVILTFGVSLLGILFAGEFFASPQKEEKKMNSSITPQGFLSGEYEPEITNDEETGFEENKDEEENKPGGEDDRSRIEPSEEVLAALKTGDEKRIDEAVLNQYLDLNPDTKGIIRIRDTVLNHPLMQSPYDEGFYLNHDVLRSYNPCGTPFLSRNSMLSKPGCNAVIYGHNIRIGRKDVFEPLSGYEDIDFYKTHPLIHIVTKEGAADYLVFAYYLIDTADSDAFVYWEETSWENEDSFQRYMGEVNRRNWIKAEIPCDMKDSYITLSSCSVELAHSGTNRMVVMARKVREEEGEEEMNAFLEGAYLNPAPLLPQKLRKNIQN